MLLRTGNRTPSAPPRTCARRGFTLVELLVTLAVVGVLVGLAMPGLRGAMRLSRQSVCTANLRQLAVAATSYSVSNQQAMPAAVLYFQKDGLMRTVSWDYQVNAQGEIVPGTVWQYTDTPMEVQQCPDYDPRTEPGVPGVDPFSGYNYNTTYIGHEGGFPYLDEQGNLRQGWNAARMGRPLWSFAHPERTALFGDGGWRNGANKYMRAPMNTVEANLSQICAGTQAFRHAGGCTCCAYLDGHVGVVQQPAKGALTTPQLEALVMDFPRNGFLSEDDSAYAP